MKRLKRWFLRWLHILLRDYFAATALRGMLAGDPIKWNASGGIKARERDAYVDAAYDFADSMMREREKQ